MMWMMAKREESRFDRDVLFFIFVGIDCTYGIRHLVPKSRFS